MSIRDFNIRFSEKAIIQISIFLGSIACLVFGISEAGFNKYITEANVLQFAVGITIFLLTFFTRSKEFLYRLGYVFIIEFNVINVLIIYLSQYEIKYSYQYVVFFLVSSWFFEQKLSFWVNLLLNISCVLIIFFIGDNFKEKEEFLLTFFVATIALVLLMLRKIKNEELLKESETRYRLIAENSADLICTHSQGGNFEFVSPSILSIAGYQPEELMYQSPTKWIHPEDVDFFVENFFLAYKPNEYNKTIQFRFRKKDNSYLWLESVVKIFEEDAESNIPQRYLSQSRSSQHHKDYEQNMLLKNKELESKNKEIEMFAYITSHDMQEPLRMITNYLQLVQSKLQKMGDESMNEFINYTLASAKNLQSLIRDILTYSTTDKIMLPTQTASVESVVNEIVVDLQMIIEEKDVEVKQPKVFYDVLADKNSLRQVFQNLILNAIKYNKSEKQNIIISSTKEGQYVTYSIADNGIGIEPVYWAKVFEPFQRLHGKSEHSGTGLGLPICKKIMLRIGGEIWLESTPGKGSVFFVKFKTKD